jgi:hypothetical protein
MPLGQMLLLLLKFSSLVKHQMKDVMVEMQGLLMNGFIIITLLTKHAHLIKLSDMIMV